MQSNFQKSLRTGFGISLLLLIISAVSSYVSIKNLIESASWVDHTNEVMFRSEEIVSIMKDAETGQRGYIITKDPLYLEPYTGSAQRAYAALDKLKILTSDNAQQQKNCEELRLLLDKRLNLLSVSIRKIERDNTIDSSAFKGGRVIMDSIRAETENIQNVESQLLKSRTDNLKSAANVTPVIIILAALLAIIITLYFFRKISSAYTDKAVLTNQLELKEKEIAQRIEIIGEIANKITAGDYAVRLNAEQNDNLGSLAGSINKMAENLEQSFTEIKDNEWFQSGRAKLNSQLAGEKSIEQVCHSLVSFIAEYTDSIIGSCYVDSKQGDLIRVADYGVLGESMPAKLKSDEGLVGECFSSGKQLLIQDIDEKLVTVFSGGTIKPKNIVFFPVFFEGITKAVVEIASPNDFEKKHFDFFRIAALDAGIAINSAENRKRVLELLEETQSQSEELQVQHRELESINAELEVQTEKLQTSEEELKVQQEELMETNQELEERSRLLEERNQLIIIRNLEIQKKSEELELSTKYKSEFLANMSHELRTPLNSILLLSRLLKENNEGNLTKDQTEYAEVIQNSGNGLLELIDEILDLSKIESGKLELDYEKVNLADIVKNMRMLFEQIAIEKKVDFIINVDKNVPAIVETDRQRVEQVLKNLLSNAFKFTSKGKVELKIALAEESDHLVDFSVTDTGIGIPADKQHLIFEAFQQADGSTKRKYGGTGLGLSISKQLATLLGGEISLESESGKGSVFTLTIPADKNLAIERIEKVEEETGYSNTSSYSNSSKKSEGVYTTDIIPEELPDDKETITSRDKTLLIVEDDLGFAKALIDLVHQKEYKAVHAVRGDKVLEYAKQFNVTGILLDVELPVKDGISVMHELKNDNVTRYIPVHIMSSYQLKKESISGGAIDFLHKPAAFEQLTKVLEKIEHTINGEAKKVLIVEDNSYHAKALAYYLSGNGVKPDITENIDQSIDMLKSQEAKCVILDMGIPGQQSYHTLETIKADKELENIPIIIFTGKSLSATEEQRIRKFADAVIIKTAQSYQRIFNEVSLFLHVMDKDLKKNTSANLGRIDDVLKGRTVLVADDDVRNIFAMNKILEKYQMKILTATDGKEALEILDQNPSADIVLMDIMMPEMDGYEAIRKIRSKSKWRNLPVIAVTAKAMTGDRDKCIEAGASDYISKPIDTDQLVSLMRVWLYDSN